MSSIVPRWIDHDTIEAPATAHGADGVIGDGALPITDDDPRFSEWADWLAATGKPRPDPKP